MGSVIQEDANSAGTIASRATVISAKTLRKRRIASIFQHYYPEGGWGYVILLCGFLVQIFTHGLQLSFGIFLPIIFHRFRMSDPVQIGKKYINNKAPFRVPFFVIFERVNLNKIYRIYF